MSPTVQAAEQEVEIKGKKGSDRRGSSGRLNCRVDPEIKKRAEEAAQLLGQSITVFTESALAERAQQVFERHEKLLVSERDFARFAQAIAEPKAPTAKLARAMRKYEAAREADREADPQGNW